MSFAIIYVLTGLGLTAGFHRLFTHRSFKAKPVVRVSPERQRRKAVPHGGA